MFYIIFMYNIVLNVIMMIKSYFNFIYYKIIINFDTVALIISVLCKLSRTVWFSFGIIAGSVQCRI